MIRKSRMGAMNRGARKTASGPHPGLLPGGEGEIAQRVSKGWVERSPERVATARTVGLQHGVAGDTRLHLPSGEGWGEGFGEDPVVHRLPRRTQFGRGILQRFEGVDCF